MRVLPPAFAFFASPPLRSLRCPLRSPCASLAPKIFSNHWKTAEKFFQSLEKPAGIFQPLETFFPIIGKTGRSFPTIGKKFSNHWKIFPAPAGRAPQTFHFSLFTFHF
jgi:hypothetical protein